MTITEPAIILGVGTVVVAILFGARLAMRAMARDVEATRAGCEASTTGASGTPDVAGVIALPPLIFLAFLVAATVLEAVVPLPLFAAHALARYLTGAALAVCGLVLIAMGIPPNLPTTASAMKPERGNETGHCRVAGPTQLDRHRDARRLCITG